VGKLKTLTAVLLVGSLAPAAARAEFTRPLLPGGIVFPAFTDGVSQNPGALALDSAAALDALFGPAIAGSSATVTNAGGAFSTDSFALGAEFSRSSDSVLQTTNYSLTAAGGVRFDKIGVGMSYELPLSSPSGVASDLQFGMLIGTGKDINYAFVVTDLSTQPALIAGVGYREAKHYNLELNLQLPAFASGLFSTGSSYSLLGSAAAYSGVFGLSFSAMYTYTIGTNTTVTTPAGVTTNISTPLTLKYTAALMVHPVHWPAFFVEFDTSNYVYFGMTVLL
jgi:hypothetical protein